MTCQEFLARYSEYLDERMDAMEADRWRRHQESCRTCARYDRVLREGLPLIRRLPRVEPSSDFFPRLQHRLFHLDDDLRAGRRPSGAGMAASLAIAGALAMLAWGPLFGPRVRDSEPAIGGVWSWEETAAGRPRSSGRTDRSSSAPAAAWPDSEWWATPAPVLGPALVPVRGSLHPAPGPYSPLIIAPPVFEPVQAVSRGGWSGATPARR